MKYLALYLRAPMQSWGASSKFGDRGTLDAPTRSGLIGLLAAACGIDKNNEAYERGWLARAARLTFVVYAFHRGDRMTDYHTVGARYDKEDSWQKKMIPTTSERKARGTDLTHRDYLTDSVFGAVLSGDDEMIDEMTTGLMAPVWGIWLGRKSCVPTEPVLCGIYNSAEDAKSALSHRYIASQKRHGLSSSEESIVFIVSESQSEYADDTYIDLPVSFARREFQARRIHYMEVDSPMESD